MKGLLIDGYYKIIGGMKILLLLLVVLGVFIIEFIDSQLIIQGYIVVIFLSISMYSLSISCKDIETGWHKYELILPIERKTVIKSKYLMAIICMTLATLLTVIYLQGLVMTKGGIYFDLGIKDISTILVTVISFSIQVYSWYYLLLFLGDIEKKEILSIVSIIVAMCTIGLIIWLLNMKGFQIEKSRVIIFIVSILELFVSYQAVKRVYQNKEY